MACIGRDGTSGFSPWGHPPQLLAIRPLLRHHSSKLIPAWATLGLPHAVWQSGCLSVFSDFAGMICYSCTLTAFRSSFECLIGSSAWNAHSTLAFPTNQNLSLCQRFCIQYQRRAITTFPLRRPSWPHSQSDFLLQQISAFLCPSLAESAITFVHNARQHS